MDRLKLGLVICLALMLMLTPLLGACAKEEEPTPPPPPEKVYVMRLASDQPPAAPHCVLWKEMEATIWEETGGRVKFENYHGGALYHQADALAAVQTGALEMALGGIQAASISPGWDAVQLPFLFEDDAHWERFFESDAYKALNDTLEAKGIKVLEFGGKFGFGFCELYNNKRPIEKLEDLEGLKMRIPPLPMLLESAKALGVETVAIAPPEVSTALETGMVDGTLGHAWCIPTYTLEKTAPYRTKCPYSSVHGMNMLVSKIWWDELPPDLQQIIERIFKEKGQEFDQQMRASQAGIYADFEAAPGTVTTEIKGAELARWREAVRPIWEKTMAESEEVRGLIEAIKSLR